MAKFSGVIGYAQTVESMPGVWTETITERSYVGDVIKSTNRWEPSENLNDDVTINNVISIIADPFANQNFYAMRYITWMGASWKIKNITVQRPRLILTIGGVYNGDKV